VLKDFAKQFLFRLPPGLEITVEINVPGTDDFWHGTPPSSTFNPIYFLIFPDVARFPEPAKFQGS